MHLETHPRGCRYSLLSGVDTGEVGRALTDSLVGRARSASRTSIFSLYKDFSGHPLRD